MKKISILALLAAMITCWSCSENDEPVFGVSLDQWELKMEVGDTYPLLATVAPSIAEDLNVTWSSSAPRIATVDKNGTVTAIAPGYAQITAKAANGKSVTLPCRVNAAQAKSIKVTPELKTVLVNSNYNDYQFEAEVLPADAEDISVTWSSSDTDVATVDPITGMVTKAGRSKTGIATITATSTVNPEVSGSATFVVMSLRVDPYLIKLFTGEQTSTETSPKLTVEPSNAPDQDFEWTSTDPAIATVDPKTGKITAVSSGSVGIVVKLKSTPVVSSGCVVEVTGDSRESILGADFDFIGVKPGTFDMGQSDDRGMTAERTDYPKHRVTLTKPFAIGKTEVTQKQWKAVMGSLPRGVTSTNGIGDDLPIYLVSYDDVQTFITKLKQLTGKDYRLPTEAEWEYAARGGHKKTGEYLYSGSNTVGSVAWYLQNTLEAGNTGYSDNKVRTVATLTANDLGLYDMSGNVAEWVNDWYTAYTSADQRDPEPGIPTGGGYRVVRNGSVGYDDTEQTVTYRWNYIFSDFAANYIGFRLAITLENNQ